MLVTANGDPNKSTQRLHKGSKNTLLCKAGKTYFMTHKASVYFSCLVLLQTLSLNKNIIKPRRLGAYCFSSAYIFSLR